MRRWLVAPAVLALALLTASCSSDSTSPTTVASVPSSAVEADGPPRVDLIRPAIEAVEAQLGGPQDYFEVNANPRLVNVIVALNDATMAQSWVYIDGELSSRAAEPAQGHTFGADALTFDADAVLGQLERDLPESSIDLFFVEGGANGAVRYNAVLTSSKGGQLQVILGPDGKVLEVDADDGSAVPTPSVAPTSPVTTTTG